MQKFSATMFLEAIQVFEQASIIGMSIDKTKSVPEAELMASRDGISILANSCYRLGFYMSAKYAFALCSDIWEDRTMTYDEYGERLSVLSQRIRDEADMELFLHVSPERSESYEQREPIFGQVVADKYPSVAYDIAEAGKCLALDRSTACVFHLMRTLESGLKSLSRALGIPYAPSWESHLKQINEKVTMKHKKKGIKWRRDESFFKEIAGNLTAIKIAWRNPTMHIVRVYTLEEADDIFRTTRTFMQRMASRFSD